MKYLNTTRLEEIADGLLSHLMADKVEIARTLESRKSIAEYLSQVQEIKALLGE